MEYTKGNLARKTKTDLIEIIGSLQKDLQYETDNGGNRSCSDFGHTNTELLMRDIKYGIYESNQISNIKVFIKHDYNYSSNTKIRIKLSSGSIKWLKLDW